MDWTDQAFVLGARRHGESSAVVQLLTLKHGRHAGLISGYISVSKRGLGEPGNFVQATWRGRLPEHLGRVKLEVIKSYSSLFLNDPGKIVSFIIGLCCSRDGLTRETNLSRCIQCNTCPYG